MLPFASAMYNEVLSTVVGCWPLMKSISTLRAGLDATVCTLQMRVECSRCIDAANSARCRCSAGITIDRMPPERSKRAAPAVSDSRFSEPSWRAVSLCRSGACAPLVKKGGLLGTPAITTRGAKEDLMLEIAEMIETVLSNVENEQVIADVRARVNAKMKEYPLFAY